MSVSLDEFIGRRLKALRTKQSQPPEKVAAYLSVPLDTYAAFELGRRSITAGYLYDLCVLFDVKVTYFFDGFETGADGSDNKDNDSCKRKSSDSSK